MLGDSDFRLNPLAAKVEIFKAFENQNALSLIVLEPT
jgi:hypothetical protein